MSKFTQLFGDHPRITSIVVVGVVFLLIVGIASIVKHFAGEVAAEWTAAILFVPFFGYVVWRMVMKDKKSIK